MIATLIVIGGLAFLCLILATTSAYAIGEVKGLTKGYDNGLRTGYYQGYADGITATDEAVETAQDTGEREVVL